jgi:hypothetical protein
MMFPGYYIRINCANRKVRHNSSIFTISLHVRVNCVVSAFLDKSVMLFSNFLLLFLRFSDGYGIIRDIVHSHILQTIALLAMEPPISLDGEDIRNEKVNLYCKEQNRLMVYM